VDSGHVVELLVGSEPVIPPEAVELAHAVAGKGLDGDRYATKRGTWSDYPVQTGVALTLIEAEVLEAVGLSGASARRNVVTRGIRLNELVGKRFRVGPVECYGDRLAEPCTHLEQLTGVGVAELAHRGGLRADILSDGDIRVGDAVTPC
jgi:MOSC domain